MSFSWFPASVGMLSICIIIAIVLIVIAKRMFTNVTRTNLHWNKFAFDKKLPPQDETEKTPTGFWNLFATTCEDIRDKASTGIDMLKNEMDTNSRLNVLTQGDTTESSTSFVEDSEPKNAESFYNIF